MIRGIVMEKKGKSAIVMTADGRFLKIPTTDCREAGVGEEIVFEAPDVRHRFARRAVRTSVVIAAATAACLALVFVWYGIRVAPKPAIAAYVTLDINPSVEMAVDAYETVLALRGLNEDGQRLVEGVAYKGKRVADLAAELIDRAEQMGFVPPETEPEIVVATVPVQVVPAPESAHISPDARPEPPATPRVSAAPSVFQDRLAEEVAKTVREKLDQTHRPRVTVIVRSVPKEVREEAAKLGMSAGKYAIYLEAASKQPENEALTPETFKRRSISELAEQVGGLDRLINVDRKPTADEWKRILEEVRDKKSGRGVGPSEFRGSTPSPDGSGKTVKPTGDSDGSGRRSSSSVRPGSVRFGDADDRDASDRFSPRRPSASDRSDSNDKGDRQRNNKRRGEQGDPQVSAPPRQNVVVPGFPAKTPFPGRDKEREDEDEAKATVPAKKPGDGKWRWPTSTDRSDRDERG